MDSVWIVVDGMNMDCGGCAGGVRMLFGLLWVVEDGVDDGMCMVNG